MFGKKNAASNLAHGIIKEALAELSSKSDKDYALGLIEMAYQLDAISMNERANYQEQALAAMKKEKAKNEPVYKKKGVYEYQGCLILKDFAKEQGAGSACWCVKPIDSEQLLAKDLTFKDAVKEIDELWL